MSTGANKALVQRFLAALNTFQATQDIAMMEEFFAPDVALHITGLPPEMQGREALKQVMFMFFTAFPDLQITAVSPILAQGDMVAARVAWSGTHTGDLMGIPPTGKRISVADMHVERIVNGKIVERFGVTDMMNMMQQIGVIPTPQ